MKFIKCIFLFFCFFVLSIFNISFLFSGNSDLNNSRRNVYLDLGAFMGDTLNMFAQNGVNTRAYDNVAWEIFSFEACPLLAHATQLLSDSYNNESVNRPVDYREISGMQEFVEKAYRENLPWNSRLRRLFNTYEQLLISRKSSRGFYKDILERSFSDIQLQLASAKIPWKGINNYYTSYACAVGPDNSYFTMKWHESNYMNGGGNILGIDYGKSKYVFNVPVIKLSDWILSSFDKNDYIYVKMDIEGMEFLLLRDLIDSGAVDFIKEMDVEWHGRFDVPGRENEMQLRRELLEKGIILRDHY